MANEKKFVVSVSVIPASAIELAGKPNGTLTLHVVADEVVGGDARAFTEFKASYSRVTAESAKSLYDALTLFVGVKKDVTADQLKELRSKILSVLSTLEHSA